MPQWLVDMHMHDLKIRVSPSQLAWLREQALAQRRTINGTLLVLINAAMADAPLMIFIHQVQLFDQPATYAVTLGESGDDEFVSPDRDEAFDHAFKRLKDLGLPRNAIRFVVIPRRENS
jgi:hypothetical protein